MILRLSCTAIENLDDIHINGFCHLLSLGYLPDRMPSDDKFFFEKICHKRFDDITKPDQRKICNIVERAWDYFDDTHADHNARVMHFECKLVRNITETNPKTPEKKQFYICPNAHMMKVIIV